VDLSIRIVYSRSAGCHNVVGVGFPLFGAPIIPQSRAKEQGTQALPTPCLRNKYIQDVEKE